MNRSVLVPKEPRRIVSLVPSQTELLFDLGLGDRVVGITKFCIHPEVWFREKTRVGGTKSVDFKKISQLAPDLIIGNKEENTQSDIEALESLYPVWMSDIKTLDDAKTMIREVGEITRTGSAANQLVFNIEQEFAKLQTSSRKRALYLIWKNPFMGVARDTFIHQMMVQAGFENVLEDERGRYPELTAEQIEQLDPEYILLSSEPFPFSGKHSEEVREQFPLRKIVELDGEMFSWYGSRLRLSPLYFKRLRDTF
jgi:ABC-type Fe3+-hydroxamate transport system substrate-binding protein